MPNTNRDKYDEVATEIYCDLGLDGQEDFDLVLTILRSAFPPPAENARQCVRRINETVHYDKTIPGLDHWSVDVLKAEAEAERFAESRVKPWRKALQDVFDAETLSEARVIAEALLSDSPAKGAEASEKALMEALVEARKLLIIHRDEWGMSITHTLEQIDAALASSSAPEAPKPKRGIKDLSDTVQFNDGMDD